MTDVFRHILIPLDASAADRTALGLAANASARPGSVVTLLVVRDRQTLARLGGFADAAELSAADAAEVYARNAAGGLRDRGLPVRAASMPSTDAARDIVFYARRHGVTLIVLPGSPRRQPLRAPLAERLVRHSPVPVLVVPAAAGPSDTGEPAASAA